jgi:acetate kinase
MAIEMILVFNSGSSTLKFGCFEAGTMLTLAAGLIDWGGKERTAIVRDEKGAELARRTSSVQDHRSAALEAIHLLGENGVMSKSRSGSRTSAVGHRVVHGGTRFQASVVLDPDVKEAILELSDVAPLHNPAALEVIAAAEESLPAVPQIAVFDTAFFSDLPARSYVYPLPYEWYSEWGVRRFGFHGISHDYCSRRAAELNQDREMQNLIVCHLGNGCSATAVRHGKPVATTMGFTPLEGLMMGSRSGSIDPGILVYLQRKRGLTAESVDDALNNRSGLLGVSGISWSFREVEQAAMEGNERARLALDIYADRVRSGIGALAVTLGAVDALIFTGGVGENSAGLRAAACEGLQCLGLHIDPDRNRLAYGDTNIAAANSRATIWIIHTREELMVAREAHRVAVEYRSVL